jgi:hypothetical protein
MLAEKNKETGEKNAWVDPESNSIWMLGDEGELLRFYGGKAILKDMSDQEINEFVAIVASLLDEEEAKEIILVRSVQTCASVPLQWDCWDVSGNYWYLRFRHGRGTIGRTYDIEKAASFFRDDSDQDITLESMCAFLGVAWAPEEELPGTTWEVPPKVDGVVDNGEIRRDDV